MIDKKRQKQQVMGFDSLCHICSTVVLEKTPNGWHLCTDVEFQPMDLHPEDVCESSYIGAESNWTALLLCFRQDLIE